MTATIHVVTGVVTRADRYLLTQRGTRSDYAHLWESPGGKVEPGEGLLSALVRELVEEIGAGVWSATGANLPSEPFFETRFAPGEIGARGVRISFFRIAAPEAFVPELRDPNVAGAGWFSFEEMRALPLVPGNVRLVEHMRAHGGCR